MQRALQLLILLGCSFFFVNCVQKPVEPQKTQLQIRQFQTRSYNSRDTKQVMKAVLNALQDEGYLVKSADKDLGFISASKEVDVESGGERFFATLFAGANARFKKSSQMEASANISEFGKETRVRMIFQTKVVDNFGSPVSAAQIEDEAFYQNFFAKVDKSLFIEKEKL
ncbi:MAG: hypothetical protein KDD60_00685 [Bdellovibrionales bacterium]|nr:hypothetical protein [Bdellovibrionales bacterium]